jgi:hypothetical protein
MASLIRGYPCKRDCGHCCEDKKFARRFQIYGGVPKDLRNINSMKGQTKKSFTPRLLLA